MNIINANLYLTLKMASSRLISKTAISMTHVEYIEGDRIGFILACCSLFPIFLLVAFVTLIAIRRDLITVFFFIGLVLNECFNIFLKHLIKEPRPDSGITNKVLRIEYGMPSSHAQFMAFFATFITLLIFIRTRLSEGTKDVFVKSVVSLGAITGAILCAISRVYLGYHTSSQAVYGIMTGIVTASVWFTIVQCLIAPYFHMIYFWKINDYMLLKDFSLIPNCLWFEYTAVRHESKTRLRRKSMHE